MSLKERLAEDMKGAMKAREAGKLRLSVLRMVKAAVKNAEIEKGKELTEDEILQVIAREVKIRNDSIPDYEKAGRAESVNYLQQEIAVLMEYLPQQMTESEIIELVKKAISETGAQGPKDMGKVMGKVLPLTRGRADGKAVNEIVKKALNGEL